MVAPPHQFEYQLSNSNERKTHYATASYFTFCTPDKFAHSDPAAAENINKKQCTHDVVTGGSKKGGL